mgnify:CR=1 FL=1
MRDHGPNNAHGMCDVFAASRESPAHARASAHAPARETTPMSLRNGFLVWIATALVVSSLAFGALFVALYKLNIEGERRQSLTEINRLLQSSVFRRQGSGEAWRGGVAIGDNILDLQALHGAGMARCRPAWSHCRLPTWPRRWRHRRTTG